MSNETHKTQTHPIAQASAAHARFPTVIAVVLTGVLVAPIASMSIALGLGL